MAKINSRHIFLAVCFLFVFLAYGQTLLGDFVFDDRNIVERQAILSNLTQIHKTLTLNYWDQTLGLYRPVAMASYAFNYIIFGQSPWSFHLVNLILYALSVWLLAIVLEKLFNNKILSYLTALFFLVLPIHAEAVANVVGRTEILALFFSLLIFWELLREKIVWWRVGIWFALALGSKETALAAAPIALLIIYLKERSLFNRESLMKYFRPALSLLAGGVLYFGARWLVLGKAHFLKAIGTIVENPLMFVSAKERVATALKVLTMYLQKIFWPFNLCSDYSYNQIPTVKNFFSAEVLIGAAFLLLLITGIFIFRKRSPVLSLASAIFLFSFLPVSNLFFPIGAVAGERLMYFPSAGICLFLAWLILKICRLAPPKIFEYLFWIMALTPIIFYGILSYQRAWDWLTEKRLFINAAQCAPQSVLSRTNLGAVYYLDGDIARAKEEWILANKIYDGYPTGINDMGLIYWKEGNKDEARKYFLRALDSAFPYYGAYENLALMAIEEKNWQEAKNWLTKLYSGNDKSAEYYIGAYRGLIVTSPQSSETVKSPLNISGMAKGTWFFEASFPVKLLDENGNIIASGVAKAEGDWMTENFVPFKAELKFQNPKTERGTLILQKDNPSGLSQNADEFKVPVVFETTKQDKTIDLKLNNQKMNGIDKLTTSKQGVQIEILKEGAGNAIPPNATLIFEVQLLGIK